MIAAVVVGQFVVIILLAVGWWREVEDIHELTRQLLYFKNISASKNQKIRELEEDNRIIINELQSIRDTEKRIIPKPEEMAANTL
jgi:hypothetical protein